MEISTIVGGVAAAASTISFAPQAWQIIKTRETKDISAGAYTLTVTAFTLWLAYGYMLEQWPIMASNAICLFLAAFILTMKLLPSIQKNSVADTLDPDAKAS